MDHLEANIRDAVAKLEKQMLKEHPVGSEVGVFLSCRQALRSRAEVVAVFGPRGEYRVRLVKPDRRGIRRCKSVHWRRVSEW